MPLTMSCRLDLMQPSLTLQAEHNRAALAHFRPVPRLAKQAMRCYEQVEALLDRVQGGPPVADDLATRFEALGYSSWAYRVVNTAGAPRAALPLGGNPCFRMALPGSGSQLA